MVITNTFTWDGTNQQELVHGNPGVFSYARLNEDGTLRVKVVGDNHYNIEIGHTLSVIDGYFVRGLPE